MYYLFLNQCNFNIQIEYFFWNVYSQDLFSVLMNSKKYPFYNIKLFCLFYATGGSFQCCDVSNKK